MSDLELKIRIRAELDQVRKALDSLNRDLDDTGSGAADAASGFDGLQKELNDTGTKAVKASTGLVKLQKDLDNTGKKGGQAGRDLSDGFAGIQNAVQNATRAIAGYLTVQAGLQALSGIANVTDEYAKYTAQLKLATSSEQELATAQAEVYRIAQATSAPVQDVAGVYAMLQRSTEKLGKSQAEIVSVLETVNKAVALTPVNAETARDTLVQFGQALSGDFKNGSQELNSILEQTPGLAKAIADGLGVATSDLKKMGEEGKLSAELVFLALQRVATSVDEDFKNIPNTVGGALTKLSNDVVTTFGTMDTSPLTDAITDLRETLTDPAVAQGLATMAAGLMNVVSAAASATAEIASFSRWVGEELASEINGPALDDLVRMSERIDEVTAALKRLEGSDSFVRWLNADKIKDYRTELDKLQAAYDAQRNAQEQAAGSKSKSAEADRAAAAAKAQADLDEARAAQERKKAEEEAAKEAEKRQKQVTSTIDSLKEQAATYGKSTEETVAYQLEVLGASEAERQMAVDLGKKIDALKAAEEAEKKAAQTAKENAREQARLAKERLEAEKKLADEMEQVRIRLAQASGNDVQARNMQLEAQYASLIERLKAKADQGGIDLVNKLINLEVARERLKGVEEQVAKVIKKLQDAEQSADARVTTGDITQADGQQLIQGARDEAMPQLRELSLQLAELEAQGVPGATEALDQLEQKMREMQDGGASGTALAVKNLRAELNLFEKQMVSNAASAAVDSLANSIMSIVDGSKSAKDAFKDFVASFAMSIAQMMARALAMYAILQILNAIPGGAAVASALDMGARVRHTGGVIGRGGTIRQVPAFAFAGAPRYHSGGVAGLKPGEVPAILQTGEEVLARNDPRNVMNGGGQQQSTSAGVRILNVVDPSLVSDYMSSSQGEEVIVNAISRNAGQIKQVLA